MQQLKHTESNYHHHFFWIYCYFFYFLAIFENLHMTRFFSNLFCEDDNTTNQHYRDQTRFLSSILLILLDNFVEEVP